MGVLFLVVGVITCADRQASKRRIQVYSWTVVGLLVASVYGLFALRAFHTGSDVVSVVGWGVVGWGGVGWGVVGWGGVGCAVVWLGGWCVICVCCWQSGLNVTSLFPSPPLPSPVGRTDDICNI